MKVIWTDPALEQLEAIYDYIAERSPEAARRVIRTIVERSETLDQYPMSSRMVPEYNEPGLREVVVAPYRMIYLLLPDRIEVIAVVHGSRSPV